MQLLAARSPRIFKGHGSYIKHYDIKKKHVARGFGQLRRESLLPKCMVTRLMDMAVKWLKALEHDTREKVINMIVVKGHYLKQA